MMSGADLIVSMLCNASFCEPAYDNPVVAGSIPTETILDLQPSKGRLELQKLKNEINGKHLKIVTYNNFPMSWAVKANNGTLIGYGVAFMIVEILQEKFNFTYEVLAPDTNFEYSSQRPEESVIGILNSSQADMAAAFIPKLIRFRKLVSFSGDLDEGVWKMMLKRPKASAAGSGLMAPFNSLVWYLTFVAVLSFGPCISFITRLRWKVLHDEEHPLPLSPSFWFVYSAFIKQGTNLAPEANTTRIMFATWWMFIILLSAFYTANLTAFLTLSKFTLDIETPEDLYKKNYRWVSVEGGAVQYALKNPNDNLYFLNKMITSGRAVFKSFVTTEDIIRFVDGGAVLVKESVGVDHLMYSDYQRKAKEGVTESDRCTYVVAPKPFMKSQRGFAYPTNSSLAKLFDSVLKYVVRSGIIDFLSTHNLPSTKICPLDLQSKDRQLRNSDLLMTYLIMGAGLCAAAAVFIAEFIIKRYIEPKFNRSNKDSKKLRNKLSRRLSKRDESQPPPYESLFGNPKYNLNENSKRKIVNGREYFEYKSSSGDVRLIPVRTPSAFLFR